MKKILIAVILILGILLGLKAFHTPIKAKKITIQGIKKEKEVNSLLDMLKEKKEIIHLALGDSVIVGYGSNDNHTGYVVYANQKLEQMLNLPVTLVNEGVNGYTSAELLAKLQKPFIQQDVKEADVISLNVGGDDILKTYEEKGAEKTLTDFSAIEEQYKTHLNAIIGTIRVLNPNAMILINNLYDSFGDTQDLYLAASFLLPEWNQTIEEAIAPYHDVVLVNVSDEMTGENASIWAPDRIHPNDKGYKEMAVIWMDALKETYKE